MRWNKAVLAVLTAMAMTGTGVAAADGKIAVLDIEKAIQATSAGKKMKAELQGEFEKKKTEFQKREADLKKMFEDLEKKKVALSEEVRAKKTQELQGEQFKFQRDVAESQASIQKREKDMLEPIAKKMEEIIDQVGKKGGYSAVLDKRATLWTSNAVDITDDVVKAYESAKK